MSNPTTISIWIMEQLTIWSIQQDKKTKNTLANGSTKGELYALDPKYADGEVHQALVAIRSN
ncbi:hypothetical protein KY284_019561 [Solanum tuberosum]|nr:hypothetical protein KY284_019561 [Solanum tuberosum]